jgi:hypothetical protein
MFPKKQAEVLPDALRWRCETVPAGVEVKGLIAGPIVVVKTHWNGKQTLPCLHDITGGEMQCNCQIKPMCSTTTGYAPIITREGERLVVPASPLVTVKMQAVKIGTYITLMRPKRRCAGLRFSVAGADEQESSWVVRMRGQCEHAIEEYLLHLWQIQELNKHFGVPFRPSIGSRLMMDETYVEQGNLFPL